MSSEKAKRKREGEQLPLQENPHHDDEQLKRRTLNSPRVEIVPGLWRRIARGRRSKMDAKPWTCSCGFVNKPIQHLFFDLPRFKCKGCQKAIPETYEFEFSLANIEANGICPLGNVKHQEDRPHCILYSSATNAEVNERVTRIFMGKEVKGEDPLICMHSIIGKLKSKKQLPESVDFEHYGELKFEDLPEALGILEEGVNLEGSSQLCKISGFSELANDFPVICKYLADGNPLLAVIRTGKGFDDLKWNEIYKPPKKSAIVEGKSSGLHCITVVGGGMRKNRKLYYKFVNTYGDDFCPLTNLKRKDGILGGFGNVVADRLLKIVKFTRYWQGVPGDSNLSCPKPQGKSIGGRIRQSTTTLKRHDCVLDEWSVRTRAADALGKLSALSTCVDPLIRDLLSMLQSGNESVKEGVLSVLKGVIKHAGRSVSSAIRSHVCALLEDLLQAQAGDVLSCAAKGIGTLSQVSGAAADAGLSLAEVGAEAKHASEVVGTMGVALSVCSLPGQITSDRLGPRLIELGLEIHGEPGVAIVELQSVDVVVEHVLKQILSPETQYLPITRGCNAVLLVNGLRATSIMELMIAARKAVPELQLVYGIAVDRVYTGTLMTSLDMAGLSITIMKSDESILKRLDAPTKAPAWPVGSEGNRPPAKFLEAAIEASATEASATEVINLKDSLNEWDCKVGYGDCGTTMYRGATAILEDMKKRYPMNDAAGTINEIGATIRRVMGGTSGILYDILCKAAYASLKQSSTVTAIKWADALEASVAAVSKYGGASAGYRTMLDALIPASAVLKQRLEAGDDPVTAFIASSEAASAGAESTKQMQAKAGRSSYIAPDLLASIPDPGAMAAAAWYRAAALAVKNKLHGS